MRSRKAIVVLGVLVAFVSGSFYALNTLFSDMCENTILSEELAPDRKHKLVTFARDCGATTGFSTQISLVDRSDDLPNESGNVFVADTGHGNAPSAAGGGPEVRVRWTTGFAATIARHENARLFKNEKAVDGVIFTFTTFSSD